MSKLPPNNSMNTSIQELNELGFGRPKGFAYIPTREELLTARILKNFKPTVPFYGGEECPICKSWIAKSEAARKFHMRRRHKETLCESK